MFHERRNQYSEATTVFCNTVVPKLICARQGLNKDTVNRNNAAEFFIGFFG